MVLCGIVSFPELGKLDNGVQFFSFCVCTEKDLKKHFHRCTVWGKRSIPISEAIEEGDTVVVSGELQYRKIRTQEAYIVCDDVVWVG